MTKRLTFSEMRQMQADQLGFMAQVAREQGDVAHVKVLWFDTYYISEPAVIRELLIKHSHQMHRDPFVSRVFKRIMGDGVFIAEGESWSRQRKLVQPAFHATRIQEYTDVMAAYTRDMVRDWQQGDEVNMNQALTQLTLRIIAKTMYDVDLAERVAKIGDTMQALLQIAEDQLQSSFVPPAWLPTPGNRRQARRLEQIHTLLRQIVAERRAEGADHGDLLSMLLNVRDENGRPMAEKQILDECVTMFVAGHETTAVTLTWAWYLLSRHPHALGQLQAEIDAALQGRPVQFGDLRQMPLLEAVVKETLRLFPPAFGFGRTALEPITVNGNHFPRKAILIFNIYAMQRRPDLFPDSEAFRPERFLDPDSPPDRYAYMPFGAGPRICLGNMFAMLEAQVILATMLQHVSLVATTDAPAEMDTVVTLRPRDPLRLRVSRRES